MQTVKNNDKTTWSNKWSYLHTPRTKPYTYLSIVDVFRSNVERSPHREMLIHREPDGFRKALTYIQLQEKSEHLAKYLITKGIQQGDAVGIFGLNSCEWVIGELAVLMAGGIAVHLHAGKTSADDNMEVIELTHCKGLILDPGRNDEFLSAIETLISKTKSSERENELVIVYLRENQNKPHNSLERILSETINEDLSKITIQPDDTAFIYTTSGSTGKPKLVQRSHFAEANVPDNFMINEDEESAKVYCDRPFGWLAGNPIPFLMVRCAHVFCVTVVAMQESNTKLIWNIIETEKCTQARLVPYHIYDLISFKDQVSTETECYKLKSICVTGQAVQDNILSVAGTFTDSINLYYGSTELYGICLTDDYTSDASFEMGIVGKPVVGYEIKLVDDKEHTVPLGELGEVYVRSRHAFSGYLGNEEMNKHVVRKGGWVRTGDAATMDGHGNLIMKGRKHDMISRGTRKIFPASIEIVFADMEGIEMAVVVGVPDDRLLEEICVCYTRNKQSNISPQDVEEYCSKQFYQNLSTDDGLGLMPKYFLEFSQIPRLVNGKLNRRQLKMDAADRLNLRNNQKF